MSKKIKLLIVIIFLGIGLSFCNEANANSITMDDITYEYENYNGGVLISYVSKTNGAKTINIPSNIDGKKVLKIGKDGRHNTIQSEYLETLTLPDTVIELDSNAIVDCPKLESIYIPYSVTTLSNTFVISCERLKTIYIDENVNSSRSGIKQEDLIKSITTAGVNTEIKKYKEKGFTFSRYAVGNGNEMEAKMYEARVSGSITIPDTLGGLPVHELNGALKGNENITAVYGGKQLTIINEKEFYGCKTLKTVDLSDSSIYSIGKNAFTRCYELETVKIGKYVKDIGNYAFEIVDTKGATDEPADDTHNVLDGGKLKEVKIKGTIITVGQRSFQRDANLQKVSLIAPTVNIGFYSFWNCTQLKEVDVRGVVKIGQSAFENCKNLEVLNFKTVESIGSHAFKWCTSLKDVEFGKNLKSIGAAAFAYCEEFPSEITLPGGFESIGWVPFIGCKNLKAINVSEENEVFRSIDGVLVKGTTIEVYPEGKDDTTIYNIPSEITEIEIGAFVNNQLTKFKAQDQSENSELKIVNGAIYKVNDSGMKLMAYPGNATNAILDSKTTLVESYALYGIKAHIIRIPGADKDSIAKWGGANWIGNLKDENPIVYYYGKFIDGTSEIPGVGLTENVTVYCVKSSTKDEKKILGNAKIKYMINGENYTIYPDNENNSNLIIEPLESGYYTENDNVKDAIISNIDWTKLELDKVENDKGEEIIAATDIEQDISSVEIKSGIKEIGDGLFKSFSKLGKIILPDTLTTIGNQVFDGNEELSEIAIPDSVTSIGKYTFRKCTRLSTITLSKNLTEISDGLFMNSGLEEIKYNDSDIKNVLSNNIKRIGTEAFSGTKLESINIPDGITTIGENAFANCKDLTDVTISKGVTTIEEDAFAECSKDLVIKGEKGSKAEQYAKDNNIKFQSITLPESITLSKNSIQLDLNGTDEEKITYTILPADADTNVDVTWTSNDEDVATVSDGRISAVGIGKCTITATTENGKSATCEVTVVKSDKPQEDDNNNSGDKDDNNNGNDDSENGYNNNNSGNNDSNGSEENENNSGNDNENNSGLESNGGSDNDNGTKFSSSNSGKTEENYGDLTSDKDIPYTGYKIALGLGIIIAGIISTLSYIKFRKMDI